jgi:hypothetical protein
MPAASTTQRGLTPALGPMSNSARFDNLWPHLEHLPQTEIDAIFKSAGTDRAFRLSLLGLFVILVAAMAAYSLAVSAFYRVYKPDMPVKIALLALTFIGIWLSIKCAYSFISHFYNLAVMRQIAMRQPTHGA